MILRPGASRVALILTMVTCVLVACADAGEEPVGLGTQTPTAGTPDEPDDTPDESDASPASTPGGTADAEPEPGFTQPHLPGDEPRVIDLPAELPIDPPGDATGEELEVLRAAGRFMASWQAILFGADVELAGIRDTATGVQLEQLVDFAALAANERWVFTGDPMRLSVLDLSVDGSRAELDVCLEMPDWIEFKAGRVTPYPSPERYTIEMRNIDGRWLAANADEQGAAPCRE